MLTGKEEDIVVLKKENSNLTERLTEITEKLHEEKKKNKEEQIIKLQKENGILRQKLQEVKIELNNSQEDKRTKTTDSDSNAFQQELGHVKGELTGLRQRLKKNVSWISNAKHVLRERDLLIEDLRGELVDKEKSLRGCMNQCNHCSNTGQVDKRNLR